MWFGFHDKSSKGHYVENVPKFPSYSDFFEMCIKWSLNGTGRISWGTGMFNFKVLDVNEREEIVGRSRMVEVELVELRN